jgi:hypothetical protein
MANVFDLFKSLLPNSPLLVGTITAVSPGGTSVLLPTGQTILARGPGDVGSTVFVRGGVIEGAAPNLTVVAIEV